MAEIKVSCLGMSISLKEPREARDLISKIRSCTVRSDLKNKAFSAMFCLFLRSDLTVQDRILEIRSLASLGSCPKKRLSNRSEDRFCTLGLWLSEPGLPRI